MLDRQKVLKWLEICGKNRECFWNCPYLEESDEDQCRENLMTDALSMLKEQEEKRITLHKKHVITLNRNDQFSVKDLYEAICETLLDEGELFIARTDNHEKVEFVFYVAEGR